MCSPDDKNEGLRQAQAERNAEYPLSREPLIADRGIGLRDVRPGSPAEKAGLESGDIIVKVADIEIQSSGDLFRALTEQRAGDTVAVQYYRNGKLDSTEVTLG